ncbi:cytochrome P460 family protein [Scandinavium sp. NPDC088450]|uniref:cytochrome P460 family protein n=1 Tax=Scandinavium sp. NPDC088450 TaxID=3364514 RepID=UPI00384AB67C
MKTKMNKICFFIFSVAMTFQTTSAFASNASDKPMDIRPIARATFRADGAVKLPGDFHHWVHVGTFVKESGTNIFDGSKIDAPLIGNTYIEPSAYRYYMETGKWADGSQIVKEFTAAEKDKNCDPVSHVCKTPLGTAIYQENYTGFGYMVKDKKRFPNDAGNWAFFTSGNVKPPYPETAQKLPAAQCSACHIAHASDQDFVFAAQKIGLDRSNPNNP